MTFSGYLRTLARESRGARGRLTFFVACLSIGVAAVVAVAGLSSSLEDGIRREARQLLAADLAVTGNKPIPPEAEAALRRSGPVEVTRLLEMVTVTAAPATGSEPGPTQLVELKVVEGNYPFYGKLELNPRRPLRELLEENGTVVGPDLLAHLHLKLGDTLLIGGQPFRIRGAVEAEPDRIGIAMSFGPRVFISGAGYARTPLGNRGSRIGYKLLAKLPATTSAEAIGALVDRLKADLPNPEFWRVETYKEAQPMLRENLRRVERFLGLVALLSLLVGGIGVAQSVRAWLAGRLDGIAILKCLGMRPREILLLYLGQTALLGLAGSLAGIAAGIALQLLLPGLFPDLIPAALVSPWQPLALLRGLGLGLGVAILFSLPPLAAVLRVPPVRVLRREAEPLPVHRWAAAATTLALAAGVLGMAVAQSGSWILGLRFTGALAAATAVLALASTLVVRLLRRVPRDGTAFGRHLWLRHGLASLARPSAGTQGAIVALGLGVLVVVGMSLLERRLSSELGRELPKNAPTGFLVDVQPDQWPGVEGILRGVGATGIASVPVVMARISSIDGVSTSERAKKGEPKRSESPDARSGRRADGSRRDRDRGEKRSARGGEEEREGQRRWGLTREQRLTYMERLPADNKLVAGKLWGNPDLAELSVEEEFARDLGLKIGSKVVFDVQGVPVPLTVTSLRTVDWRTFGINFFWVVEPGVLEAAPQFRLAVAQLPRGSEQRTQDLLAAKYPNVTLLRTREILDKILGVLHRIAQGIRFLGGFTVLAGVAILAGSVSAGSLRRGREAALLKTLGVTRRGVASIFAVEHALTGLIAGVIGTAGGLVVARELVIRGFELPWELDTIPLIAALAGSVLLATVAGLAASLQALRRRPIEVLRSEG
jgi:putative ABC transport system permease protein